MPGRLLLYVSPWSAIRPDCDVSRHTLVGYGSACSHTARIFSSRLFQIPPVKNRCRHGSHRKMAGFLICRRRTTSRCRVPAQRHRVIFSGILLCSCVDSEEDKGGVFVARCKYTGKRWCRASQLINLLMDQA